MKYKYLVPNGFTAVSMLCGFASILSAAQQTQEGFEWAAWFIAWGVLLDKLDGTSARLLDVCSDFGVEFDSFADLVVFGLAPGALFYFLTTHIGHTSFWVNFGFASTYVVCTATRLARFNVSTETTPKGLFIGLPTTLSGAVLSTGYLSTVSYLDRPLGSEEVLYLPVILVCFAFLMISPFHLPKLQMHEGRPLVNLFQFSNVFICYILTPLCVYPQYLFFCASLYLVVGFGSQLIKHIQTPQEAT